MPVFFIQVNDHRSCWVAFFERVTAKKIIKSVEGRTRQFSSEKGSNISITL